MNLDLYKQIYLVGIGGIGMSALARYFNAKGRRVFGYDKLKSDLCIELQSEGINIHYTAVSYTHLRAHETVLDLVCRLLLEKK